MLVYLLRPLRGQGRRSISSGVWGSFGLRVHLERSRKARRLRALTRAGYFHPADEDLFARAPETKRHFAVCFRSTLFRNCYSQQKAQPRRLGFAGIEISICRYGVTDCRE